MSTFVAFLLAAAMVLCLVVAIALTALAIARLAQEGLFSVGSDRGWSERQGARNAIGNKLLVDPRYATLRKWLLASYSASGILFILLFIIVEMTK